MRRQGGRFKQLGLGFNWVIGPHVIDCASNWKTVQTIGGEGFSARNVLQTRSKIGRRGLFKFDNRFGEPRTPCKAALKSTMTSIRKFPCFWLLENSDRNFLGNFRKISNFFQKNRVKQLSQPGPSAQPQRSHATLQTKAEVPKVATNKTKTAAHAWTILLLPCYWREMGKRKKCNVE